MSVLSTSNRKTMSGILLIAPSCDGVRLPRTILRSTEMLGITPSVLPAFAEELLRDLRHTLRLEPVFSQQLLERGRRAERLHTHDATGCADVAFPAEGRRLLHRDARGDVGRQHAVLVRLRLMLENIPGRHRDHARADALRDELLVGVDAEADLAARRDQDQLRLAAGGVGEHVGAAGYPCRGSVAAAVHCP